VVVERLEKENPPSPDVAPAWLPEADLFKPSGRVGQYAAADGH